MTACSAALGIALLLTQLALAACGGGESEFRLNAVVIAGAQSLDPDKVVIAGREAGKVAKVEAADGPGRALLRLELDGTPRIRRDATVRVCGDVVYLTPGRSLTPLVPEGGTLPAVNSVVVSGGGHDPVTRINVALPRSAPRSGAVYEDGRRVGEFRAGTPFSDVRFERPRSVPSTSLVFVRRDRLELVPGRSRCLLGEGGRIYPSQVRPRG